MCSFLKPSCQALLCASCFWSLNYYSLATIEAPLQSWDWGGCAGLRLFRNEGTNSLEHWDWKGCNSVYTHTTAGSVSACLFGQCRSLTLYLLQETAGSVSRLHTCMSVWPVQEFNHLPTTGNSWPSTGLHRYSTCLECRSLTLYLLQETAGPVQDCTDTALVRSAAV